MPERYDFNPTGHSLPKRGFRERRALDRISRLGLLLPDGSFRGKNKKKTTEVDGMRTAYSTVLKLTVALPHEGVDAVERSTSIAIERDRNNLYRISALTARSCITDDVADYLGVEPKYELFSLANYDNELSIRRVANEMSLAVNAVRQYRTQAEAATPAYP